VVKHAQAQTVSVVLGRSADAAIAVVEDDGVGFDPTSVRPDGFGVEGMRERVSLLDGRLRVQSRSGGGTTIAAEVPLR